MSKDDNVVRLDASANDEKTVVRPAPASAAQALADEAESHGGPYRLPPEYEGSFGRTLFDDRSSEDGSVTVVSPAEEIANVPSQSLIRITSPDKRKFVATVTAGPFCEPDGLPAGAPQLVVTAVRGHNTLPRHHGRMQATILGEETPAGIVPARRRPRPNSAVHLVESTAVARILNLEGDRRLGLLHGHDDVEVRMDTKKKSVLPRHSAHIGTTGGGKSTGVGRTVTELQKSGTCVFLFDVEGEYTALDKPTDNAGLKEVLRERDLSPEGVKDTHVYRLCGCTPANPAHPSSHEFTLQFDQISPFTFGEIMDLSDAQADRLFQAYELVRSLFYDFDIFPRKNVAADEELIRDIDEFERGWPKIQLEDLRYVVGGVINFANGRTDEEPRYPSQFKGKWNTFDINGSPRMGVKQKIAALLGGKADDPKKKVSVSSPTSWKALQSRLSRLVRLKVFDRGPQHAIDYEKMVRPGRVNIIDLSDLENMDVRNLAISEMLRGILARQQVVYDAAVAASAEPPRTNVIIEEAHEFLSAKRVTKMPTLRDQLTKIAKRGRKRYLGLTFVTQSPNDLPDDVLGLVNNWVIYKIDEATIRRLKTFVPSSDDSLWTLARGLGPGQALVSFSNMRRPVITAVDPSPAELLMTE